MQRKRFAELTAADIEERRSRFTPQNTKRMNNMGAQALRDYLHQMNEAVDFEGLSIEQLDNTLARFYNNARTRQGELYRGKTLQSIRYAIARHINGPPHNRGFDIIGGSGFSKSRDAFKVAMAEIKVEGKGEVRHIPPIEKQDLLKLYNSMFFDPNTPTGLANKVQFDIRMYFMRRAHENLEKLTKTSFMVVTDSQERKFVQQVGSELTKNRREMDLNSPMAAMPATGGVQCPVASFERYLSLLHPDCDRLWVFPVASYRADDQCWYTKKPMGYNTLRNFLPKVSKQAQLSKVYTNHSIRATGITVLSDANYSPIDICSASTHKSISSLASYQKTSLERRIQMGGSISASLGHHSATATKLPSAISRPTSRPSTSISMDVEASGSGSGVDISLPAHFFDDENEPLDNTPTVRRPSLFSGCTIGTVNINIQKF